MAVCRYKPKPYENVKHEIWLGHANTDLSFVTEREYIPILSHRAGSMLNDLPFTQSTLSSRAPSG